MPLQSNVTLSPMALDGNPFIAWQEGAVTVSLITTVVLPTSLEAVIVCTVVATTFE